MEPWHADVLDFLEIRLNQGDEEARCRDLFSAMWIPDLFMKRVESGGNWSLFCPDEARGLADVYGKEFEDLYEKYEAARRKLYQHPRFGWTFPTISIIPHKKETKGALVSLSLSFFLSFFLSLSLSLSLSLFSKEKPLAWAFIVFFERARMSQHDLYLGQGFRFVLSLAIVSRFSL